MNFYVVGMPRCRTLWMSHLLTSKNSTALHEYFTMPETPILPDVSEYVGSVDTNPRHLPNFGRSPVIKIHRPDEEIVASMVKSFDVPTGINDFPSFCANFIKWYRKSWNEVKAPVIEFDELSNPRAIKDIVDYLIPMNAIKVMQFSVTMIKTTNRNLEFGLNETARAYNMKYSDFIKDFSND